jgi:hypothetical protein
LIILIRSYLTNSTSYEAPHYEKLSNLLLFQESG